MVRDCRSLALLRSNTATSCPATIARAPAGADIPPPPEDRIATAGSCFAQHISRSLSGAGFRYLVTEPAPEGMDAAAAAAANYGTYSARYGNIYTARQLKQLLERASNPLQRIAAERAGDRLRSEADERAGQLEREAEERATALVEEARARAESIREGTGG